MKVCYNINSVASIERGRWFTVQEYLVYVGQLLLLTLGVIVSCGLVAWLAQRIFIYLVGFGSVGVIYASSVIGTPIHELGHALMCLLFAHKITDIKLLLPPNHPSGTLGYVEHSYNRKNMWAVLGNLFIGVGPIFSGLGVMILVLYLCFPSQWSDYLQVSGLLASGGASVGEILSGVFSLLRSLGAALSADGFRAFFGMIILLSVSQHITLSAADIRGALAAMPLYLGIVAIFAGITMGTSTNGAILQTLWTVNLRVLSLFSISIAFSVLWILLGCIVYVARRARTWF